MGKLWGILCEAGKQIRRHLVITYLERTPVGIPSGPSRVVPGGDAHVRMPELAADVTELNSCREELGRERVP